METFTVTQFSDLANALPLLMPYLPDPTSVGILDTSGAPCAMLHTELLAGLPTDPMADEDAFVSAAKRLLQQLLVFHQRKVLVFGVGHAPHLESVLVLMEALDAKVFDYGILDYDAIMAAFGPEALTRAQAMDDLEIKESLDQGYDRAQRIVAGKEERP